MSKITVRTIFQMYERHERIAMLTTYDYPTAQLLDAQGIHILLVGDSLGMVVQGHATTVPVTLEQMIYHTSLVTRAATRALVVADMPFMSYSVSIEDSLRNATRLMQEGGAHAVKVEGGNEIAPVVRSLVQAGIPVMGHIGFTPQSVHSLGGYSVKGRTNESAKRLLDDALALQNAGAFAVVLELVPAEVAKSVTGSLGIPTIGIGAGTGCDGQVLVFHDIMGLTSGYIPKHNKRYANLAEIISSAASAYLQDVQSGTFPGPDQTIYLKADELSSINEMKVQRSMETDDEHANR